jgi:predicted dienelactone hydrolase
MRWVLALIVIGAFCFGIAPRPVPAQDSGGLTLEDNGPYSEVGRQEFSFTDESRDRTLTGYIFYPSGMSDRRPRTLVPRDNVPPAADAAPFPLVFYSHAASQAGFTANSTMGAAPYLASFGFAVVSIDHRDPAQHWLNLFHRPMDILFVLDQLATGSGESELSGLIDFEQVGVTGFSLGGRTALMLTGARIDPSAREQFCATTDQPGFAICDISPETWQEVLADRERYDPPVVAGEPWPPYTDPRIKAVVPVAPCYGPLFGDAGLAAATVPTLIIGLEADERCQYERDALYMYEHLGSAERALLTVSRQGHEDSFWNRGARDIFNHFAVAFLGYYLQGKTEYAQYLSAEYVSTIENLAWVSTME